MPAKAPGAYAVHNICGDTMRWEQVVIYAAGALMVIGVATSVFQLYGVALAVGCMLRGMALTDGPRGFKILARDVKRHGVRR